MEQKVDVVVVGGGLTGLAVACLLGREKKRVVLLESGSGLGGRARTTSAEGFQFNLGPHALYRGGAAAAVLGDLGVTYSGAPPPTSGGYAIAGNRLHTFPAGLLSLLTTGLLQPLEKLEAGRVLQRLDRTNTAAARRTPLQNWLRAEIVHENVRRFVHALVRVSTYTDDAHALSAGAALDQLRLALRGVLYIDGGWQTLVDGLTRRAQQLGVELRTGDAVTSVLPEGSARRVVLRSGGRIAASSVVIATGPRQAQRLVPHGAGSAAIAAYARSAEPVRLACLDVALRHLPRPRAVFGLGIDEPVYASVHSAVARLAPGGGALIHVARYGGTSTHDQDAVRQQLRSVLDLLQPGWRELVVRERFLPDMIVSHAIVTAVGGGTAGRPDTEVPGLPGVYVAGDWVGPEGMLADAALASARQAARRVLAALHDAERTACLVAS